MHHSILYEEAKRYIKIYYCRINIWGIAAHLFYIFFLFFLQGFWTFTEGVHTYFIEKIIVSNALTCSYLIVFGQGSTYIITTFSFTISRISWTYKKDIYLFFFNIFAYNLIFIYFYYFFIHLQCLNFDCSS